MPTLDELVAAAKRKIDRVNAKTPADLEWQEWANESAAELWDLLVTRYEDQFTASATTAATHTGTISLADMTALFGATSPAFFKLRAINRIDGDRYVPLDPVSITEMYKHEGAVGAETFGYMLVGDGITLLPRSASAARYAIFYVPAYTSMATGSDTLFTCPNGWHEYVVVDMCIKARAKFEEDATLELQRKAELRRRIEQAASNRTPGGSRRIVDRARHREDW